MADRTVSIVLTGTNAKALKALNETGAAAERNAKTLGTTFDKGTSKVGGLFTKLDRQLGQFGVPLTGALGVMGAKLEQSSGKSESFGKRLEHVGDVAAVTAAAGIALVGTASVKAALEGEVSQARLETAIANTGKSYSDYGDKIDSVDSKMADLGFNQDEVASSVAALTNVTHDAGKALELEGLAADLARTQHISLADATSTLTAVEAGRFKGVAKIIGATKDANGVSLTSQQVIEKLTAAVKGQADAYTGTYAGSLEVAQAKVHNLEEELGQKLLPALADTVGFAVKGVDAFEGLNSATGGLVGKMALLSGGTAATVYVGAKLYALYGTLAGAVSKAAIAVGLKATAEEADAVATTEAGTASAGAAVGIGAEGVAAAGTTEEMIALAAANKAATASTIGLAGAAVAAGAGAIALGTAFGNAKMEERARDAGGLSTAIDAIATGVAGAIPGGLQFKAILGGLGIGFGDSGHKADDLTSATDKLTKAQKDYQQLVTSGTASDKDLADAKSKVTDAARAQATEQAKVAAAQKLVTAATDDGTGATQDNADATAAGAQSLSDLVSGLEAAKVGFDNEKTAAQGTDTEIQALSQHLKDLNESTLDAANADLRLRETNLQVGSALKTYGEKITALKAAKVGDAQATRDAAEAGINLEQQMLSGVSVAEANAEAIDKLKIAHGENISAIQIENDKHAAAFGELEKLKGQYPALTGLIEDYERKLGLIPPKKTTEVTAPGATTATGQAHGLFAALGLIPDHHNTNITVSGAEAAISAFNRLSAAGRYLPGFVHTVIGFAKGGKLADTALVGEEGRELFFTYDGSTRNKATGDKLASVTAISDAPSAKNAAILGQRGEGLFTPDKPGTVVPHGLTEKILAHRNLSQSDVRALHTLGVTDEDLAPFYPQAVPALAAGGSLGAKRTIKYTPGTQGGTSGAADDLNQFVDAAMSKVPDAESVISDFASKVADDMRDVADATKASTEAFKAYHDAVAERNKDARQVAADERDLARLRKEGAEGARIKIATDRLAADQEKLTAAQEKTNQTRSEAVAAQRTQERAQKQAQKDRDPAQFTKEILAKVAGLKLFGVDLKTIFEKFKDDDLARALATAGPEEAGPVTHAFAASQSKSDAAERALEAEKAGDADYKKILEELGIKPKERGGRFAAGELLLVGEKRPELVKFDAPGTVLPNTNALRTPSIPHPAGPRGGTIVLKLETNVDPITGRVLYRLVKDDQDSNGPWNIKIVA